MEKIVKAPQNADKSSAAADAGDGMKLWGGVFGMVLARQLAARRSLVGGSVVRLDEIRQKLGRVGARLDSLEQL